MALVLAFGAWGVMPVERVAAATYSENFDTDSYWTNVSGANFTSYGIKEYANTNHPEVTFRAEVALRENSATQDGFPGRRSEPHAWRLRDAEGSFWQAKITTGGVGTFSFWIRRWDNSPNPNYVVEHSVNNGTDWTTVVTIDNTWLDNSSDWKQVSGTINTPNGEGSDDDIIIRIRRVGGERVMIDDFVMTDYPLSVDLTDFSAAWQGDAVLVSWETAQELDNLGFNLYRSDTDMGPWVKLNDALIPSQNPGAVFGAVYEWLDADVTPGATYFYRLEDVDIYFVSTFHGPVSTAPVDPSAVSLVAFGSRPAIHVGVLLGVVGVAGLLRKRRKAAA